MEPKEETEWEETEREETEEGDRRHRGRAKKEELNVFESRSKGKIYFCLLEDCRFYIILSFSDLHKLHI